MSLGVLYPASTRLRLEIKCPAYPRATVHTVLFSSVLQPIYLPSYFAPPCRARSSTSMDADMKKKRAFDPRSSIDNVLVISCGAACRLLYYPPSPGLVLDASVDVRQAIVISSSDCSLALDHDIPSRGRNVCSFGVALLSDPSCQLRKSSFGWEPGSSRVCLFPMQLILFPLLNDR